MDGRLIKLEESIYTLGKTAFFEKSSKIYQQRHFVKQQAEFGFNLQFNELYQIIKYGEPKVGACDSCLEWFSDKEKTELKNILNNMHKNIEFLEEETWTNKKEKY